MANNVETQEANFIKDKVAKNVTTIVLTGTCIFGLLGIVLAIVAIKKDGDVRDSKDILQILFSAILPLFGTWIGTILAYYFSKENLLAANQTVRHLVDKITSDQKLQSIKASSIMIPESKLIFKPYSTGTDDSTLNLKTDFLDFINQNKISRIILLDENKVVKYVLHKNTIESFIASQYFETLSGQTTQQPKTLTFADLKTKGNQNIQAILSSGVQFLNQDATLADAKLLMKNYSVCNDIFITSTGKSNEPVLGWITDKTIAESSII